MTERDIELPKEVMLHYFLYCLNLKSGKVEWQKEFYTGQPPGGRHRKNSFVSESPVTDGKFVYVYVANLGLWAFDLKGKLAWTTPLEANPIYLDFGTGSSPALAGNLLVIVSDNEKQQYIAAFDKQTGKQVWRTNRDIGGKGQPVQRSGWATPFVWRHALRTEIVAVLDADAQRRRALLHRPPRQRAAVLKKVQDGRGEHELSPEEDEAIRLALAGERRAPSTRD